MKVDGGFIQVPKMNFDESQVLAFDFGLSTPLLGDFAYQMLAIQFQYILDQETGVLDDSDPEYLHQMRVGFRRFQAAIAVFSSVIVLPSKFEIRDCKRVLKRLGTLRDLDVQLQGFAKKIKKALTPGDQRRLIRLQRDLSRDRGQVYKQVSKTLRKSAAYQNFKCQMGRWLKHPRYQAIAQLPVSYCAPDLLSPLVSRLLLHPAWFISQTAMMTEHYCILHDLRKLCKQVRYQGEFFQEFYPPPFKTWIKEVKSIQSDLGQVQDACVFQKLMARYQSGPLDGGLVLDWDSLRQHYCDPVYRGQLHQLILSPTP